MEKLYTARYNKTGCKKKYIQYPNIVKKKIWILM